MYENSKWWRPVDRAGCTRESLERDHGVVMRQICTIPDGLTKHVKQLHEAAELNHCRVQNVQRGLEQLTNEPRSGANAPQPKRYDIVVFTDKGVITAVFVIDSITAVPERADTAPTLRDPNPATEPHNTTSTLCEPDPTPTPTREPRWWVTGLTVEEMDWYSFKERSDISLEGEHIWRSVGVTAYDELALSMADELGFRAELPQPGDLIIVTDGREYEVYEVVSEKCPPTPSAPRRS